MTQEEETKKRNLFKNILIDLSKSQEMLQDEATLSDMVSRLEALYYSPVEADAFRHYYSDVFTVLTEIYLSPEEGNITFIGQNLDVIRENYQPHEEDGHLVDIRDPLRKLFDHVSLDTARLQFSDATYSDKIGETAFNDVTASIASLSIDVADARQAQETVESELAKQQKEYIAILGIFAAVVLAFTGGIAFSTSVLNNIDTVSPYRIIVVALVIGLVLINVMYALFYYVDRLVNEPTEKSMKPLWFSNIVIIVLLVLTLISWTIGGVERRDFRVGAGSDDASIYHAEELVPDT